MTNFEKPRIEGRVEDVDKAWAMAEAGDEDREKAIGERILGEKFADQEEGYLERKLDSSEWFNQQAESAEQKAAYDYELANIDEELRGRISSAGNTMIELGVSDDVRNSFYNEVNQNIIEGKYNKNKAD